MEKKLPKFHPGIPAIISIIFALITGIVCAKWLNMIMNL